MLRRRALALLRCAATTAAACPPSRAPSSPPPFCFVACDARALLSSPSRWLHAPRWASAAGPAAHVSSAESPKEGLDASTDSPPAAARKTRQPNPRLHRPNGYNGKRDGLGRPAADADTVALLVDKRVFDDDEVARSKLFHADAASRFPFVTARDVFELLKERLGGEEAAGAAIRRAPVLLNKRAATLARYWDSLHIGGGGRFTEDQVKRMVVRSPILLCHIPEWLTDRIALLERHGVDAVSALIAQPCIHNIGVPNLVAKIGLLKFFGYPVGPSLASTPVFLLLGPPRMRDRFFVLQYHGALVGWDRCPKNDAVALGTWVKATHEQFARLSCFRGTPYEGTSAAKHAALVASPEFVAFAAHLTAERGAEMVS